MPIQASPLQLEGYFVQEFHFAVRDPPEGASPLAFQMGLHPQLGTLFNPGDLTINTQIGGGLNQEEPKRIVSIVRVESRIPPEIKYPYDFLVVMVGYFRLNTDPPAEVLASAMDALRHTAASVLYSAAREFIASVTGRGPFPAAILPTAVIALDPAKEHEQLQKKALAAERREKGAAKKAARKKGKKAGKKA